MTLEALRTLYDIEQRRDVVYPGVIREVIAQGKGSVVRQRDAHGAFNAVIYSDLNATNADDAIRTQIDFFSGQAQGFEWKYFGHDHPADMRERLAAAGLRVGEVEAVLVMDLENAPAILFSPVTHDIRRVDDADAVHGVLSVQSRVFGDKDIVPPDEENHIADQLAQEMRDNPGSVSLYAAYADEGGQSVPVSAAWVRFPQGSQFGSLWGGATLKAYRKRGFYTALLSIRVQEARERGRRFLTVDASPMSRPILERQGFVWVTDSYPCEWDPEQSA